MPTAWLARVRHDLIKHILWPARDRRDAGGAPEPGELVPQVIDGEGKHVSATALWAVLRAEAPPGLDLSVFDVALERALAAAETGDVAGVLALEPAFELLTRLVRSLEGG